MKRFRFYIVLTGMLLAACTGVGADSSQAGRVEKEYFAVFMAGQKVGYGTHERKADPETVKTTETVHLSINRGGTVVSIAVKESSLESRKGEPLGFESVQDMGMLSMTVKGVKNGERNFDVTVKTAGATQQQSLDWPAGALMPEGLLLLSREKGLKEGTAYPVKMFSALMLQAMDAQIRVGPTKEVDLLGRVVPLTEVAVDLQMNGSTITQSSYVDDNYEAQKMIIPMMGMVVELVACSREFALSKNDEADFLDRFFLPSPVPLSNVKTAKAITYHLEVREGKELVLPQNDNQTVRPDGKGGLLVTVQPVAAAENVPFPYTGSDPAALEALKPTRYLQSDDPRIIDLARKAVGNTQDAAEAARRIESFVHEYITAKDLSIGYASAVEVAQSRQGDCSEHAVLTAAMCRAVGIPAQVVMGYVYCPQFMDQKDFFGGHAWDQVYIGNQWVGIDATRAPGGYSAGHIAQAAGNGNPEDFFALITIMGRFAITEIKVVE
jgi:hypothetical protein